MSKWYLGIRGVPIGPLTKVEAQARARDCGAPTLVWHEGMPAWVAIGDSELAEPVVTGLPSAEECASFWRRFGAFLVDLVFYLLADVVMAIVLGVTIGVGMSVRGFSVEEVQRVADRVSMAMALGLHFFYFAIVQGVLSGSPGKRLLGLRVVLVRDGGVVPLGILGGVKRYFAFLIASVPFYLGLLWAVVDQKRRGLHDRMVATIVVSELAFEKYVLLSNVREGGVPLEATSAPLPRISDHGDDDQASAA